MTKFATALQCLKLTADPAGGDSMYAPTLPTVRSVLISSGVKNACKRAVPIWRMRALNRSCENGLSPDTFSPESCSRRRSAPICERLSVGFWRFFLEQFRHRAKFFDIAVEHELFTKSSAGTVPSAAALSAGIAR